MRYYMSNCVHHDIWNRIEYAVRGKKRMECIKVLFNFLMSHAHIPMHIAQTKSTQRKAKQKSNLLKSCKQISILLI